MADGQTLQLTIGKAEGGMDWLQWSSSIVSSIAWPIAVVALCVIFREPLTRLIDKLKKASFAGAAIEMALDDGEERIEVAEAVAPPDRWEQAAQHGIALDEMPPSLSPANQARRVNDEQRAQTAISTNPAGAIEEIWRQVERAVREAAKRKGANAAELAKPIYILSKHMKGQDLFTTQIMVLLSEIRKVRNLASHNEQDVTENMAQRYFRLAFRLISLLESL